MAQILITGSADGLGQLAAKSLADQGHTVVLHARNAERARYAQQHVPAAAHIIIGDLSDRDEIRSVAEQANAWGTFNVVIHNAGVYQASPQDILTVNTLAPYMLTCLIHQPKRLIYLSSSMHRQGHASMEHLKQGKGSGRYFYRYAEQRPPSAGQRYRAARAVLERLRGHH